MRRCGSILFGLMFTMVGLVGWLWASPGLAAPLSQIVQPGDVATPTPTYVIVLVPTPTPAATSVTQVAVPHGEQGISTYTVKAGDTLLTVALEVGVDVDELPCAVSPTFRADQPLVIGDRLEVAPAGWLCHQVREDETLDDIAAQYHVEPMEIAQIAWNQLGVSAPANALPAGRYLRIPPNAALDGDGGFLNFMLDQPLSVSPMTAYAIGGTKPRSTTVLGPYPKDWPYGSGNFMWPVYGWMSQGYRGDHRAIDIAAAPGTFVAAADRGVVVRAGWNEQGYGTFVVIDHNIDYMTLYAHLTEVFVKEGDVVAQGEIIGTIGSTGNSTGPHLHFEIRDFGQRINPLDLLIR